MANRTVKDAKSIRGTNPQFLIEKIIRSRIYESKYWKEECFALSAELIVDKAMEIRYLGGVFGGNIKPTPFLCLVLKMLQIQPEKDIVVEFIKSEEFKYVRALGAFYMRLVGSSVECYKYLEPLYNDSRKLRRQTREGAFQVVHMDEFIDELLREERVCDIILPRIQFRHVLEEANEIEPRISAALEEDADDGIESSADEDDYPEKSRHRNRDDKSKKSPSRKTREDKDRSRYEDKKFKDKERDRDRDRDRRERERERERDKQRDRSRSRERRHRSRSPRGHREKDRKSRREHERDRHDRDYDRYDRDKDYDRHDRDYNRHDRDRDYERYDRGFDRDRRDRPR